MIQFEIGKTYRLRGHEFLVSHRSKCYVTVHDHVINDDLKLKIRPADDGTCETLYIRHPAGYLRADSPTEATTPETAQPATAPEYSNCNADINEAYSDAPGDNSAPMQDIPPDHVPDIAPAHDAIQPQTATTLITIPLEYEVYPTAPQITKFIIGGFYLVSHDGQYRYYMRVIARDDYSITFEDFTSGVHYSFHITIDYRISGCAENVKPDCPFARILEASASRDFVGIPAREYTRHPVFLPGKSYSAYPEIDSEIRRVSFSVNKRVKLKNDSGCCVLLRGKVSGYSFNEPVDCSVNVCRLNPSDPEDFNIGVCKFSAVSPDEDSPATPDDSPVGETLEVITPEITGIPAQTHHEDTPQPAREDTHAPAPSTSPSHVDIPPATTPAQFLSASSHLIHAAAWRRSLVWLFLIFWVFCLRKSDSFDREMAADFHIPLGSHELRLTETRGLEGNALRDARYYNAAAVLHAPDRDSLTEGLAALSAPAVKNIGRNLGLLSPKEKGSGGYLGGLLADRLFAHRTTQSGNQPRTYTDCKRQIVIIFD